MAKSDVPAWCPVSSETIMARIRDATTYARNETGLQTELRNWRCGKNKQHSKCEHIDSSSIQEPRDTRRRCQIAVRKIDFEFLNFEREDSLQPGPVRAVCVRPSRVYLENRYRRIDSASSPSDNRNDIMFDNVRWYFRNRFCRCVVNKLKCILCNRNKILTTKHLLFLILIGETVALVSLAPSVKKQTIPLAGFNSQLWQYTRDAYSIGFQTGKLTKGSAQASNNTLDKAQSTPAEILYTREVAFDIQSTVHLYVDKLLIVFSIFRTKLLCLKLETVHESHRKRTRLEKN